VTLPVFYFVAQTGQLYDRVPSRSNYYVYEILTTHRDEVEAMVGRAALSSSGLTYSKGDLERLAALDEERGEERGNRS
jgi:hypothetical protein